MKSHICFHVIVAFVNVNGYNWNVGREYADRCSRGHYGQVERINFAALASTKPTFEALAKPLDSFLFGQYGRAHIQ
ncbi:hypothetical protein J2Z66_003460 [Paenibacillus eucommiae]|uniref:Uncharacterized protein n=1 Tax=Paenibacillus eucommiae TaxID=1355755 RepID=A0ABS4IW79_9BACL|nr:hypothetical protein [Paenibacillus eucommiae]